MDQHCCCWKATSTLGLGTESAMSCTLPGYFTSLRVRVSLDTGEANVCYFFITLDFRISLSLSLQPLKSIGSHHVLFPQVYLFWEIWLQKVVMSLQVSVYFSSNFNVMRSFLQNVIWLRIQRPWPICFFRNGNSKCCCWRMLIQWGIEPGVCQYSVALTI